MKDDVGFQSQMFGEQVAQRRDRYAQWNIQSSQQMAQLPGQFIGAMQARQKMDLEKQRVASELANDELHRQDAIQKLQWARELHTTDMIELQKRSAQLDFQLKEAQVQKAQRDLQPDYTPAFLRMNTDEMFAAISMGIRPRVSNGKVVIGEPDPELQSSAQEYIKNRYFGRFGERTNRIISLDLERAEKAYQRAEEDGDEEGMNTWAMQRDALRSELRGLSGGSPLPARAKPAPSVQDDPKFKQRVKDYVNADPGLPEAIGANNSDRLYTVILRDIDKYKSSLEKMRQKSLTDMEAANIVSQMIQSGMSNPETPGHALLQWFLQDGTLDPQEFNLAQERASRNAESADAGLRAKF